MCLQTTLAHAVPNAFVVVSSSRQRLPNTVPAYRDGRPIWLQRGRGVVLLDLHIASTSNDNSRYAISLMYRKQERDCSDVVLALADSNLLSTTHGSSNEDLCDAWFWVSAPVAHAAARAFAVPTHDRTPIGHGIVGRFRAARASYAVGEAVEIHLEIANAGGVAPVILSVGGRDRGPRDNQFNFEVTRDGQRVDPIDEGDFGGWIHFVRLDGSSSHNRQTRLEPWASLNVPGHYVVVCHFATELLPGHVAPMDTRARDHLWDIALHGIVEFDVREQP